MNKQLFIFFMAAFYCCDTKGDTPDKPVMHASMVTFQGVKNIPGYTFYWKDVESDKADTISNDNTVSMAASGGRPFQYMFWGINDVNRRSTDTIYLSNHYAPDYVLILEKVKEDSIYYTQKELSNANTIVSEGNTDSIANKQLVADAKAVKRNHYIKIGGFILAGLAAIGGIILFFVKRRKKKTATESI